MHRRRAAYRQTGAAHAAPGACRFGDRVRPDGSAEPGRDSGRAGVAHEQGPSGDDARPRRRDARHGGTPARRRLWARRGQPPRRSRRSGDPGHGRQRGVLRVPDSRRRDLRAVGAAQRVARRASDRGPGGPAPDSHRTGPRLSRSATRSTSSTPASAARPCATSISPKRPSSARSRVPAPSGSSAKSTRSGGPVGRAVRAWTTPSCSTRLAC